jgi:hypothetical protein
MFDGREKFEGEKQIAEMISSLKRVDAPGDFDTRVRTRIARAETVSTNSWAANLIRTGVPLAAAVLIALGGYFTFMFLNSGQSETQTVADVKTESPQVPPQLTESRTYEQSDLRKLDETVAGKGENGRVPNGGDAAKDVPQKTTSLDSQVNSDRLGGGSVDMAAPVAPPKIYPKGLNPNSKAPTNSRGVDPNTRIPVASILEFIGVKATWAGGGWRVDAVEANNIAGRSGIKSGDVIETINGQTVDKKTTFPAKFDGKSVRVRRDGEILTIDFKP